MRPIFFSLLLVSTLACIDIAGLDEEIEAVLDDSIVASVICTQPLAVLEEGECQGKNVDGTILRDAIMKWLSSDPAVLQIDQDGLIIAVSVGTVTVTGTGARGVSATFSAAVS